MHFVYSTKPGQPHGAFAFSNVDYRVIVERLMRKNSDLHRGIQTASRMNCLLKKVYDEHARTEEKKHQPSQTERDTNMGTG